MTRNERGFLRVAVHGWICMLALVVALFPSALQADQVDLLYSFADEDSGGVGQASIDVATGRIVHSAPLLDLKQCRQPAKVRVGRLNGSQVVAVANLQTKGPHLFLVYPGSTTPTRSLHLPSIPDELRFVGSQLLVTCEEDALVVVDLPTGKLRTVQDIEVDFNPPANGPEDICIDASNRYAIISFQKDGRGGKKQGNRLAIYDMSAFRRVADILLPRSRTDLHLADNPKENGPGPEVIQISESTDLLLVTLDLYGAVGTMKWSAARAGTLADWNLINTSLDDQWGTAFPDRVSRLQLGEREFFWIANAGVPGGAVMLDPRSQKVIWKRATPPGLEPAIFFSGLRQAYSVCSGKTKQRTASEVTKTFNPGKALYVFDFSSADAARNAPVDSITFETFLVRIHLLNQDPPLLAMAAGDDGAKPDTLVIYDPVRRAVRDQQPALGAVAQFAR